MAWRHLEPSNPVYTQGGLHFLTFYSDALKSRGAVSIYIPPMAADQRGLPLVLLLHGASGSELAWPFQGGAHLRAGELIAAGHIRPMGLVMPADGFHGDGSGYANLPHKACEDWIVEDVPACVAQLHPAFNDGSPLFIAGLSMGGFGAMRIGAKYPKKFAGISSHSAPILFDATEREFGRIDGFHGPLPEEDTSVLYWMRKNRKRIPPLRFDCGVDDFLLDHNRRLHDELVELGITHSYEEFPGAHSWDYWHDHLGETLLFFSGILDAREKRKSRKKKSG